MPSVTRYLPTLCCLIALATGVAQADEKPAKIKALLITGGCCHDYKNQTTIISQGLSQRANISFDVVHEDDNRDHQVSNYTDPNWAMGYDIIVHNECYGGMTDDALIANITNAHRNGVPGIFIHCALHSYRNATTGAEGWRENIGVTSKRHEKKHPLKIEVLEAKHPIMTEFPNDWPVQKGELYVIEKTWMNCQPLAQAFGVDTEQNHPVVWINKFGDTKMFGTSLGHFNETMNNDVWLGMVTRGALWATGHLNADGTPEKGYEGTGIQPIDISLKPTPDPISTVANNN